VSGYPAESLVAHIRRCCHFDEHPEVCDTMGTGSYCTYADRHSLLNDPNTSSPANVEASNLYKENRKEYTKRVRETVEKSWDD